MITTGFKYGIFVILDLFGYNINSAEIAISFPAIAIFQAFSRRII